MLNVHACVFRTKNNSHFTKIEKLRQPNLKAIANTFCMIHMYI